MYVVGRFILLLFGGFTSLADGIRGTKGNYSFRLQLACPEAAPAAPCPGSECSAAAGEMTQQQWSVEMRGEKAGQVGVAKERDKRMSER